MLTILTFLLHVQLGNSAASSLATSLRTNRRLQNLNLFHNMVGTKGALALADALVSGGNETLLSLDLNCNLISSRHASLAIEQKLRENNAYFHANEEERYVLRPFLPFHGGYVLVLT